MFILLIIFAFLFLLPAMLFYGGFYIRRAVLLWAGCRGRWQKLLWLGLSAALSVALVCVFNVSAIIALYLVLFFGLADLVYLGVKRLWPSRKPGEKLFRGGILPVLAAVLLLGYGAANMASFRTAEYGFTSDKLTENFTAYFISDTHYATVQSPVLLARMAEEISEACPDVLILGGDMVEENTSREAMAELFEILGNVKTEYGVYYIYGNHDRQTYSQNPKYTDSELRAAIEGAGIKILQDGVENLPCGVSLLGREDKSQNRAELAALTDRAEPGNYRIVLDHQPSDLAEIEACGVDLGLSGHTHAGQIWPLGWFFRLLNSPCYGEYSSGNSTMVVSSGFTGWGYPLRTQGHCEAVKISVAAEDSVP